MSDLEQGHKREEEKELEKLKEKDHRLEQELKKDKEREKELEKEIKEDKDLVAITVNGTKFEVRPGRRLVAELKKETKVPATFELEQVIDNKLVPLADDSFVIIKCDEVFVSHPRDSQSS